MDSSSLFPFNVFSPTSASNSRRKRTKFIKTIPSAKPKLQPKKPDSTAPANNVTPPCSECGKKFWSWKALFGHMRCHPERQWRGINPPSNFLRASSSVVTDQQDHEIAACLIMLANAPNSIQPDENAKACLATDSNRGTVEDQFDLNLPPPVEEESSSSYSSGIVLDLRLGFN